ncbi:hypothetical protein N7475_004274 [Penicillium sp. IBT 31633x]|nr:hypothetical protein N7475_004274 [Penicillium sp. IBT 31633x]
MVKPIRVRDAVREPLPRLLVNRFHTTSSALKRLMYRGELNDWANFCQDVRNTTDSQNWTNETIKYSLNSRNLEENEVFVGDETGVQGRFQQAIGQALGMTFRAQTLDIRFADFKCIGDTIITTPDCVMKTLNNQIKVVGEFKVPWVDEHSIALSRDTVQPFNPGFRLRILLAQPLKYMKDLQCMYGFLSTYEETIFLR